MKKNCRIKIISFHDAKAECSCGWYMVFTGKMTEREIYNEHRVPTERIGINGESLGKVITHSGSGVPLYELLNAKGTHGIISIDGFHRKYIWLV